MADRAVRAVAATGTRVVGPAIPGADPDRSYAMLRRPPPTDPRAVIQDESHTELSRACGNPAPTRP
ncbi:hypothetical protein [Streptomyces melanogenes]|uniref:hypothetical protein n=1 Tax=Streptomyces melanogenes TaxID=67326 RepID=UPI00379981B3